MRVWEVAFSIMWPHRVSKPIARERKFELFVMLKLKNIAKANDRKFGARCRRGADLERRGQMSKNGEKN